MTTVLFHLSSHNSFGSAAGKTQLALQLSLFVQVPTNLRGLSGATCYLTTSSSLPTERLLQIAESNGLSLPGGGLEHVHTIPAPTVAVLLRILEDTLPSFIEKNASRPGDKKVKLLVIDALGELFHLNDKTTMNTLVQRSKDITTISARLHELASKHKLAVLVLNEVIDVFDRPLRADGQGDLLYETQSRWFSSAWAFGDGKKEASLGLVWANQLNVRIMLSRTGRRRYLNEEDLPKRQRQPVVNSSTRQALEESRQQEPALIRRLGVIFSSVSSPIALDYIVTESGISILQEAGVNPPSKAGITSAPSPGVIATSNPAVDEDPGASAPESTEALPNSRTKQANHLAAGDEFDDLLTQDDSYDNVDWDTLELNLSQAHV